MKHGAPFCSHASALSPPSPLTPHTPHPTLDTLHPQHPTHLIMMCRYIPPERRRMRLDRVLLSAGSPWHPIAPATLFATTPLRVPVTKDLLLSDHYGIAVDLEWHGHTVRACDATPRAAPPQHACALQCQRGKAMVGGPGPVAQGSVSRCCVCPPCRHLSVGTLGLPQCWPPTLPSLPRHPTPSPGDAPCLLSRATLCGCCGCASAILRTRSRAPGSQWRRGGPQAAATPPPPPPPLSLLQRQGPV